MSHKLSHSKIKNTGILFELLSRQLTVDVLNDNKNSSAIDIIKRYFNENTELGKELQLYQLLLTKKCTSEGKSNYLIDMVIKSRQKLKNSVLRREKYNLIREIKEQYEMDDFFKARIPNYKIYASIYKLFLAESSVSDTYSPGEVVDTRYTLLEHISSIRSHDKQRKNVLSEYEKQDKDLRLLAHKLIIDKFNKRYSNVLNVDQKRLLKEYINNISNTNKFKEFVTSESSRLKYILTKYLPKVNDSITQIKLTECIHQLDSLQKGQIVTDKQTILLMRYYQLVDSIKDTLQKRKTV